MNIDDFKKLEIKIGKILSAEKVEGSSKLLKLEVDFGFAAESFSEEKPVFAESFGDALGRSPIGEAREKRQIVSGIAEFYQPTDIIGKEAAFVTNLEPKTIMGIESNGMILAVRSGENLAIIGPDKDVLPGSLVK